MGCLQSEFAEQYWQTFDLTEIKHRKPPAVAEQLQINVAAVYVAKSRVVARQRVFVENLGDN